MNIKIIQNNPVIGDIDGNFAHFADLIQKDSAIDVFVFPELALQGYMAYDYFAYLQSHDYDEILARIAGTLLPHQHVVIGMALPYSFISSRARTTRSAQEEPRRAHIAFDRIAPRQLVNCACVICPTKKTSNTSQVLLHDQGTRLYHDAYVAYIQPKQLLPHYDVFYETRYFPHIPQFDVTTKLFAFSNPAQNEQKEKEVRCTLMVCEDIWNPLQDNNPVVQSQRLKPDIMICLSASPFEHYKLQQRLYLCKEAVKKVGVPLLYVNLVGGNDEIVFDGSSFVLDSHGALLDILEFCQVDTGSYAFCNGTITKRTDTPSRTSSRALASLSELPTLNQDGGFPKPLPNMERVSAVIERGLQDFLDKTRFARTVHVGLSGGIDSALTAVLAVRALGKERVKGILLPSPFTSDASTQDATELARRLDIATHTISIKELYHVALQELAETFSAHSAAHTLTEENAQARLRGMLLMAYSNRTNSMLLTTGNKSEIAVGYSTLYGDMCGSLNLIGDLYKTEVYTLAEHLNMQEACIPLSILEKEPSAELREHQKDSDSLPAYDVLDEILYRFIECRESPSEVHALHVAPLETIQKVWDLYIHSEYKRYQAAPIIKLSAHAFGRGRLVPLASDFSAI